MSIEGLDYARIEARVFADMPRRYSELCQRESNLTVSEILERKEISDLLFQQLYRHHDRCYKIEPPVEGLTNNPLCNCNFGKFELADRE